MYEQAVLRGPAICFCLSCAKRNSICDILPGIMCVKRVRWSVPFVGAGGGSSIRLSGTVDDLEEFRDCCVHTMRPNLCAKYTGAPVCAEEQVVFNP